MHHSTATGDSRLLLWRHVREFAVPPSMIETAAARRAVGDWAGACAAAHVDVDLDLRALARTHGHALAAQVRTDLRHLAPDLLRWHLPRIAPDGLLRPGLTITLSRYSPGGDRAVQLVARTPPAWADAGQRISLSCWEGSGGGSHPHPHPDRRFRLDLHRHLWDARRAAELWSRSGADRLPISDAHLDGRGERSGGGVPAPGPARNVGRSGRRTRVDQLRAADLDALRTGHCAVDRWADEARLLLHAEQRSDRAVLVRVGGRRRLVLRRDDVDDTFRLTTAGRGASALPVLPDAATWVPPDLALLRAGLVDADRLHPLVAAALVPGRPPADPPPVPDPPAGVRLVDCRGARHRLGLVDGVLVPLDHDPVEIRREELLAALTGTPLPCLRLIDEAHRHPECLVDVRARLDHGDTAGALAAVEDLLGPAALLRDGPLREVLDSAARRRVAHGLFRAGLVGLGPARRDRDRRPRHQRSRPRHGIAR